LGSDRDETGGSVTDRLAVSPVAERDEARDGVPSGGAGDRLNEKSVFLPRIPRNDGRYENADAAVRPLVYLFRRIEVTYVGGRHRR